MPSARAPGRPIAYHSQVRRDLVAILTGALACAPLDLPGQRAPGGEDAGPESIDSGPEAPQALDAGQDAGPSPSNADAGPAPDLDAGFRPSPAADCPVPGMKDLYPGLFPPNPYGSLPAADSCVASAHDAIIVLGCPNEQNGDPAACQIERADIAVALMNAGYGHRFIVSGAAVHTPYVEADTLRALLIERGVPAEEIWREPRARHTDENLYYSSKIMEAQGWASALVVSEDPGHLVMTAVCDSNCCVDLGRLTVLEFSLAGGARKLGHYVRYPWAAAVSSAECYQIRSPLKLMCTNLDQRLACAADFKLEQ